MATTVKTIPNSPLPSGRDAAWAARVREAMLADEEGFASARAAFDELDAGAPAILWDGGPVSRSDLEGLAQPRPARAALARR